ncbi:hypothetical protein SCARR_00867 [Pontiella sulfatireligans]|uniref:Pectate lyase superfamily protein domain-containing protein n=1 Tax=Pontiella sulfatireligans TaxID=2750658 RepID=A0A6C2UHI9_9BACT|nr:hypothetical protein SCARR_00867 [Pontiella sulfatireligans]
MIMMCSRQNFLNSVPGGLAVSAALLWTSSKSYAENDTLDRQWVAVGRNGKLEYKKTPREDRIMDFSHAGYMGGGVALPKVPAKKIVGPSGGDDTARIQAAINQISEKPLVRGFRGAVLLKQGTFRCSGALKIAASGVVLRGAGMDKGGTTIEMVGEPHVCIHIESNEKNSFLPVDNAAPIRITDDYVPSGTIILTLEDASDLTVGDAVIIRRPITSEWISFMGMDTLVRDGENQTWINPGSVLNFERRVRGIRGNRIALDVALSDSIDARFTGREGATVVKAAPSTRISHIGVEGIRIISKPPVGDLTVKKYEGIELRYCKDCWVRYVSSHEPVTVVRVNSSDCTQVTLQEIEIFHSQQIKKGAGYPADFLVRGSRVLIDRCSSKGDGAFFYSSLGMSDTSAVILNCDFHGKGSVQPHMRWNTGLLVDACRVPDGGIEFINRRTAGSGHGWTIGWAVAWNCVAGNFKNEQPPGSMNWVVGCSGKTEEGENFLSHGQRVTPGSLYLAQLRERLGTAAVRNIGYGLGGI